MNNRTGRALLTLSSALALCGFSGADRRGCPASGPGSIQEGAPAGAGALAHTPAVDALLAQMVEAMGGADAVLGHTCITQTGTIEVPGTPLRGEVTIRSEAPDKLFVSTEVASVGTALQGYDGSVAWEDHPVTSRNLVSWPVSLRMLSGKRLALLKSQAIFFGPLQYKDRYEIVEVAGVTEFEGKAVYDLMLSHGRGDPVHQFVDVVSHRVVGTSTPGEVMGNDVDLVTAYSAFREFDGLILPTVLESDLGGIQRQRVVILNVDFAPHPAGTFTPPDEVGNAPH